jgi:hypothetical protein
VKNVKTTNTQTYYSEPQTRGKSIHFGLALLHIDMICRYFLIRKGIDTK